jgi:hypothetical protein
MLIPERYTEIRRSKGRSLQDIGVGGCAFAKADALDAVASLVGSQVAIAGGDVLSVASGRPRYTYDNWYVDRRDDESLEDYLARSWVAAERYIREYPDPQDGTILYALVLAELGVPGSDYTA